MSTFLLLLLEIRRRHTTYKRQQINIVKTDFKCWKKENGVIMFSFEYFTLILIIHTKT